jgi:hypothetical protein
MTSRAAKSKVAIERTANKLILRDRFLVTNDVRFHIIWAQKYKKIRKNTKKFELIFYNTLLHAPQKKQKNPHRKRLALTAMGSYKALLNGLWHSSNYHIEAKSIHSLTMESLAHRFVL